MDHETHKTVALVTGVGRPEGIGFELCRQLAARGMVVILTAREHDMARSLARWPELSGLAQKFFAAWRQAGPNTLFEPDSQTSLKVESGQALELVSSWDESADAWYLDGFSPARNPDMWSAELMQAVYDHTVPHGSFSTYAAAGWVRRNLAAAGFTVERKAGFGSKREMLAGVKG
jgi:tRNA U34 5-methylaminomethyl-2-thiouridine-forming methyltransferase MnmC